MRPSRDNSKGKDYSTVMANTVDYIYHEALEGRYKLEEATFRDKMVEILGEGTTKELEPKIHSMYHIVNYRLTVPEYVY